MASMCLLEIRVSASYGSFEANRFTKITLIVTSDIGGHLWVRIANTFMTLNMCCSSEEQHRFNVLTVLAILTNKWDSPSTSNSGFPFSKIKMAWPYQGVFMDSKFFSDWYAARPNPPSQKPIESFPDNGFSKPASTKNSPGNLATQSRNRG